MERDGESKVVNPARVLEPDYYLPQDLYTAGIYVTHEGIAYRTGDAIFMLAYRCAPTGIAAEPRTRYGFRAVFWVSGNYVVYGRDWWKVALDSLTFHLEVSENTPQETIMLEALKEKLKRKYARETV